MAQLLFESVPVVSKVSSANTTENPTVLTVHRMLDPQLILQYEAAPVHEESDLFQCGRCKKQFSSIQVFMSHKAECNNSVNQISDITLPTNVCGLSQNAVVRKIQIPSSLTNYQQSVILTEADFLQLSAAGLDSNITSTSTTNTSIQISPSHTVLHQPPVDAECASTHIQQVLHHVTTTEETQHPVELSILNDKLVSRPLILTSQPHGSAVQSLVLNIGNPAQPQTIICSNSETDETSAAITEATDNFNADEQGVCEKEPSTVNIITEFHSSMVKIPKKQTTQTVIEDNQLKKDHKLSCAYCSKTFTKNFDLQQHIRSHTGEKPFQCIVCGRAFAQKSNVKKHMQTHKVWPDGLARTLPPLPVKSCTVSSDDAAQDSNSVDAPLDENGNPSEKGKLGEIDKSLYACPYCKYIGKSYHKLKSHMKEHDTEKVYKCILTTCGLMFNDLDPFLEHTRSHENEMTYRCHECNLNFASLFDLGSHQLTHTVDSTPKSLPNRKYFQCNLCLNKYATPAALNHHLTTSDHSYPCRLCDKVFPCERYLRRHLQIHSEAESYTCNICGKGFRTDGYLKVHMLVHSEKKPYECSTCKAAFNRKDKLKRHMLIHEPVKRHKCPFRSRGCPREFNRADKLKSHILTHSCIKPYNCKVCGRTFTRKAHLRDHVKQNHNEKLKMVDEVEQLDKNNSGRSLSDCDYEKSQKCKKSVYNRKRKSLDGNFRLQRQRKKVQTSRNREHLLKRVQSKVKDLLKLNAVDDNSDGENFKTRGKIIKDLLKLDSDDSSKEQDVDSVSDLADDIPTAHIEIISAHGTLVPSSDLTHISLGSDMNYGDLQFDTNVDETDVPSGSPITVEVINSSNSNSLLPSELHSTADISDFS